MPRVTTFITVAKLKKKLFWYCLGFEKIGRSHLGKIWWETFAWYLSLILDFCFITIPIKLIDLKQKMKCRKSRHYIIHLAPVLPVSPDRQWFWEYQECWFWVSHLLKSKNNKNKMYMNITLSPSHTLMK